MYSPQARHHAGHRGQERHEDTQELQDDVGDQEPTLALAGLPLRRATLVIKP